MTIETPRDEAIVAKIVNDIREICMISMSRDLGDGCGEHIIDRIEELYEIVSKLSVAVAIAMYMSKADPDTYRAVYEFVRLGSSRGLKSCRAIKKELTKSDKGFSIALAILIDIVQSVLNIENDYSDLPKLKNLVFDTVSQSPHRDTISSRVAGILASLSRALASIVRSRTTAFTSATPFR